MVGTPGMLGARSLPGVPTIGESGLPKDRKSTRLNSSHPSISYAVCCLEKKITGLTTRSRAALCLGRTFRRPAPSPGPPAFYYLKVAQDAALPGRTHRRFFRRHHPDEPV